MFENRVVRGIFGPKIQEMTEARKDCIMRSFIAYTLQHTLLG
jgi:hypothetical protein